MVLVPPIHSLLGILCSLMRDHILIRRRKSTTQPLLSYRFRMATRTMSALHIFATLAGGALIVLVVFLWASIRRMYRAMRAERIEPPATA